MSFRLVDLNKSIRKGRDGYRVTPARLEGRQHGFQIEFVLQQFEQHLGQPRRALDPDLLLDFIGDARLGRALLVTLSQWYRMRPRTFAEVLPADGKAPGACERLLALDIAGPVDLRASLYSSVNSRGPGYLDPEDQLPFWQGRRRALGVGRAGILQLMVLDRPEEAVLVRTGPRPVAADVMAAYNARAHTTLLRSATEVIIVCDAEPALLEQAARCWAEALGVRWRVEGGTVRLSGQADALGCWTRHGRRVERAVLELLALSDLAVREISGTLHVGEKQCRFRWTAEALAQLGFRPDQPFNEHVPGGIDGLLVELRRERARAVLGSWRIRRSVTVVGVEGSTCMPHLELSRDDRNLFLRVLGTEDRNTGAPAFAPFNGKTPLVAVQPAGAEECATLCFPGGETERCTTGEVLSALGAWLSRSREAAPATSGTRRALRRAA